MTPILVGAALALVATGWVMAPLLRRASLALPDSAEASHPPPDDEARELAFDVAAGRLSPREFARLVTPDAPPDA